MRTRESLFSGLVLASLVTTGCGMQRLPAPAPPAREVPRDVDLPDEPPAVGTGRVILDANGDKAKVVEITGAVTASTGSYTASVVGLRPLCTTPCVLDLPYGSHPLVLQSTTDETRKSTAELEVGPKPKIFRHALGEKKDGGVANTVGSSVLVLGVLTALTGGILWGTGALASSSSSDGATHPIEGTGQTITAVGAVAILAAIPLLVLGRPSERPGSTTEWTLPGAPPGPGRGVVNTGWGL